MNNPNDDDVIELGEGLEWLHTNTILKLIYYLDGTFDIPSQPKVVIIEKHIALETPIKVEYNNSNAIDGLGEIILSMVEKNSYKVFSSNKSNQVHIVFHLDRSQEVAKVKIAENKLIITLLPAQNLELDLEKFNVEAKSTLVSTFENFVTVRLFTKK